MSCHKVFYNTNAGAEMGKSLSPSITNSTVASISKHIAAEYRKKYPLWRINARPVNEYISILNCNIKSCHIELAFNSSKNTLKVHLKYTVNGRENYNPVTNTSSRGSGSHSRSWLSYRELKKRITYTNANMEEYDECFSKFTKGPCKYYDAYSSMNFEKLRSNTAVEDGVTWPYDIKPMTSDFNIINGDHFMILRSNSKIIDSFEYDILDEDRFNKLLENINYTMHSIVSKLTYFHIYKSEFEYLKKQESTCQKK